MAECLSNYNLIIFSFFLHQINMMYFWPCDFQIRTSWTIRRCQMWHFWWRGSLSTPTKYFSLQPPTGTLITFWSYKSLTHAAVSNHFTHSVKMLFSCHILTVHFFLPINKVFFFLTPLGSYILTSPYHVALTITYWSCHKATEEEWNVTHCDVGKMSSEKKY